MMSYRLYCCILMLWVLQTWTQSTLTITTHPNGISSVTMSTDKNDVISASNDGTVKRTLVDGTSVRSLGTFSSITGFALAGSIAIVSQGLNLRAYNIETGSLSWTYTTKHIYSITEIASNGIYLVSGDQNGGAHQWSATNNTHIRALSSPTSQILSISLNSAFAFAGINANSVQHWALSSGTGSTFTSTSNPVQLVWATETHLFFYGSALQMWRISDKSSVRTFTSAGNPTTIFANGDRLFAGYSDSSVKYWLQSSSALASTIPSLHTSAINSIVISDDYLITGSSDMAVKRYSLGLYTIAVPRPGSTTARSMTELKTTSITLTTFNTVSTTINPGPPISQSTTEFSAPLTFTTKTTMTTAVDFARSMTMTRDNTDSIASTTVNSKTTFPSATQQISPSSARSPSITGTAVEVSFKETPRVSWLSTSGIETSLISNPSTEEPTDESPATSTNLVNVDVDPYSGTITASEFIDLSTTDSSPTRESPSMRSEQALTSTETQSSYDFQSKVPGLPILGFNIDFTLFIILAIVFSVLVLACISIMIFFYRRRPAHGNNRIKMNILARTPAKSIDLEGSFANLMNQSKSTGALNASYGLQTFGSSVSSNVAQDLFQTSFDRNSLTEEIGMMTTRFAQELGATVNTAVGTESGNQIDGSTIVI